MHICGAAEHSRAVRLRRVSTQGAQLCQWQSFCSSLSTYCAISALARAALSHGMCARMRSGLPPQLSRFRSSKFASDGVVTAAHDRPSFSKRSSLIMVTSGSLFFMLRRSASEGTYRHPHHSQGSCNPGDGPPGRAMGSAFTTFLPFVRTRSTDPSPKREGLKFLPNATGRV